MLYMETALKVYSTSIMLSADEELTALPVDGECIKHEVERNDDIDLDFDLELAAAVHNDDFDDYDGGQRRPDQFTNSDDV